MNEQELRFSVDQFNEFINQNFELIGNVVVEGEITQMNITAKGGANIVIKDDKKSAILSVSGYAPYIEGIKFVKEGMKVAVWGKPNIWSQAGKFSLKIYKILPLGEGALKEAYELLKQRLYNEGLFSDERKRPLPEYVTKIALLTGKDSAAHSDFIKIMQENKAGIEIDYYPVQVQGKYSEQEILHTLKTLPYSQYDCVVMIRGGGSLEDLITFNSENIARQIFSLPIPIIVGVGHEKDESIADFVADVRASTPSQAAYYLITNNEKFIHKMDLLTDEVEARISQHLLAFNNRLNNINYSLNNQLQSKLNQISQFLAKTNIHLQRLPREINSLKEKLSFQERLLNSLNPKNILQKGYVYTTNELGEVISSIDQINEQQTLSINFIDGKVITKILEKQNGK